MQERREREAHPASPAPLSTTSDTGAFPSSLDFLAEAAGMLSHNGTGSARNPVNTTSQQVTSSKPTQLSRKDKGKGRADPSASSEGQSEFKGYQSTHFPLTSNQRPYLTSNQRPYTASGPTVKLPAGLLGGPGGGTTLKLGSSGVASFRSSAAPDRDKKRKRAPSGGDEDFDSSQLEYEEDENSLQHERPALRSADWQPYAKSTRKRAPPPPIYNPVGPQSMSMGRPKHPPRPQRPPSVPQPSRLQEFDDTPDSSFAFESEEPEELRLPYGGYLQGKAADPGDRAPDEGDRKRFARARQIAERKLAENITYTPPESTEHLASKPAQAATVAVWHPGGNVSSMLRGLNDSLTGRLPDSRLRTHDSLAPHMQPAPTHDRDRRRSNGAPQRSASVTSGLPDGAYSNIQAIRFGQDYEIKTWYQAPYPEEFAKVTEGRLWLCEFCLKYFKGHFQASRHRVSRVPDQAVKCAEASFQLKCKMRHPPGDEIYRDGSVSVWEVDGRKNKVRPSSFLQ